MSLLFSYTTFIIAVTVIISILAFNNLELFDKLRFNAYAVNYDKEYGRLLSHALIHSNWLHLGVNMYVLWQFGIITEAVFQSALFGKLADYGRFIYIMMYILAIPVSSLPALLKYKNNYAYNAVGASGAVSAVVFSFILFFPTEKMGIIFIPIQFPAIFLGLAYLVYSYIMAQKGRDNIGHDAHFVGAVFGFTFPIIINPSLIIRFWEILKMAFM